MVAAFARVALMHVVLLVGGIVVVLFQDTRPAVAVLVTAKVAADVWTHHRQNAPKTAAQPTEPAAAPA